MSKKRSSSTAAGIGTADVLTIIFVVLKLVGVINWSWWWVLSPLWIGFALLISICVIAFVVGAVASAIVAVTDRRK
jgi:hypothetical protein